MTHRGKERPRRSDLVGTTPKRLCDSRCSSSLPSSEESRTQPCRGGSLALEARSTTVETDSSPFFFLVDQETLVTELLQFPFSLNLRNIFQTCPGKATLTT